MGNRFKDAERYSKLSNVRHKEEQRELIEEAFEQSVDRNRELLTLLAKEGAD